MLTEIGLAILGYALLSPDLPSWIGLDAHWQHGAAACADPDLPRHAAFANYQLEIFYTG
jgi:hypothetical protein